eukprot:CAMPEP_0114423764 /NCGR_PEP_ID=MMETSP0103-20121206/6327_1 /TAXON_ID=37642 ORGANISM="Paraphysomonas imperforata, Strain PA2" /NCGR_SAMPLE_ID=MMETSP0103 /ASSEMBLY_ACC=CAM_ASM_000201 /LENGTH=128 /DNA_ID=CAMNT_0001592457 /DNA_START=77 /DNA_END=464 /DNA_ORIENTATION=-
MCQQPLEGQFTVPCEKATIKVRSAISEAPEAPPLLSGSYKVQLHNQNRLSRPRGQVRLGDLAHAARDKARAVEGHTRRRPLVLFPPASCTGVYLHANAIRHHNRNEIGSCVTHKGAVPVPNRLHSLTG